MSDFHLPPVDPEDIPDMRPALRGAWRTPPHEIRTHLYVVEDSPILRGAATARVGPACRRGEAWDFMTAHLVAPIPPPPRFASSALADTCRACERAFQRLDKEASA